MNCRNGRSDMTKHLSQLTPTPTRLRESPCSRVCPHGSFSALSPHTSAPNFLPLRSFRFALHENITGKPHVRSSFSPSPLDLSCLSVHFVCRVAITSPMPPVISASAQVFMSTSVLLAVRCFSLALSPRSRSSCRLSCRLLSLSSFSEPSRYII